jgi:C-terminal processing protease CtpA/Prc
LLHRVLKEAGGAHSHMVLPYRVSDVVGQRGSGGRAVETAGVETAGVEIAAVEAATEESGTRKAATAAASASRAGDPPLPEGRLIEGAAYLSLPTLSRRSGGPLLAHRYIAAGSRLVAELAAAQPHGWIVDLRENTGGNMWPMIAAVAGLLERGVLGRFLLPDGRSQAWRLRRGYVSLDRRPMARVRSRRRRREGAPLAALISPRTASAGEAALIALRSQTPSRTFGSATAGMTTGNITHVLRDGTRLMISVSYYADADGQLVSGVIEPDEAVAGDGDVVLERALGWVSG